jgi:hypothetical protein
MSWVSTAVASRPSTRSSQNASSVACSHASMTHEARMPSGHPMSSRSLSPFSRYHYRPRLFLLCLNPPSYLQTTDESLACYPQNCYSEPSSPSQASPQKSMESILLAPSSSNPSTLCYRYSYIPSRWKRPSTPSDDPSNLFNNYQPSPNPN